MYKGNLRPIVLKALSRKERSGYKLMHFLEENTGKKPSAGSMYPLLEELHKEGLVNVRQQKRSKIYSLTKKGKLEVKTSLKKVHDIHKKLYQMISMFSHLVDDKQMAMIKDTIQILQKDKSKINTFKDEMLAFKIELIRILKQDKKENIIKAKKIIVDATKKFKQLK